MNTARIFSAFLQCSGENFCEDFVGIFSSEGNDGAADKIGVHMSMRRAEYAGESLSRCKAKICEALFHQRIAGNPDNAGAFARFQMTERKDHDIPPGRLRYK